MADSFVGLTFLDYSKEKSRMDIKVADITDGTTLAARITQFTALISAIGVIAGGSVVSSEVVQNRTKFTAAPPANPIYQRENKWLVTATDTSGNVSRVEIPTADLTLTDVLKPNSDEANWNGSGAITAWTDFVAAFEAIYRNKYDNAVTVRDIRFVGRNL